MTQSRATRRSTRPRHLASTGGTQRKQRPARARRVAPTTNTSSLHQPAVVGALATILVSGVGLYGFTQAPAAASAPQTQAPTATVTPSATVSAAPPVVLARQKALTATLDRAEAESERLAALGKFYYPTIGEVGSKWGMRFHPILRVERMHGGVDVGAPCDAPVWAVLSGTVVATGRGGESGNYVKIDHGIVNGKHLVTASLHMNRIDVKVGDKVNRGEQFGLSGSTGLSTSCHVHLALYVDGVNSDPLPYLNA